MPRPQAALTLAKLRSIAKADAPGRRQCPHMQPPPGPRMPCITTQDARRSADQCLGKLLESNNMQGAESRGELLLATLTKGNYMVLQIIIPKNDHHETCGSKYNITIYAYIYQEISLRRTSDAKHLPWLSPSNAGLPTQRRTKGVLQKTSNATKKGMVAMQVGKQLLPGGKSCHVLSASMVQGKYCERLPVLVPSGEFNISIEKNYIIPS